MSGSSSADQWIASESAENMDITLAFYDCLASRAHVLMLEKQGIMSSADAALALQALEEITEICRQGEFSYRPGLGAQLTLEAMIVERAGEEVGYQVHTGRSRNDQVLVAQKLCVREMMLDLMDELSGLIFDLLQKAEESQDLVMPGYTHMQPARPTTAGQWLGCYADMLLRDLSRLKDTYVRNNTNPLGAAESHGTSWNLDREYTRVLLGFGRVSELPLETISARGEAEADFLAGLAFVALHLSKLAQDLLLFSTFEYGYVSLGDQAVRMGKLTGSSIMPQKRNPDVLELLRAQVSSVYAHLFHILDLLQGLPSGYNRDSRDSKTPALEGISGVTAALAQARGVIRDLQFNEEAMLKAVSENHCMATDLAEYLAQQQGVPFRVMHRIVGRAVAQAIEEGRLVSDLTPEDLDGAEVTQEEIQEGTDPHRALARRAPEADWLARRFSSLHGDREWLAAENELCGLTEQRIIDASLNLQ